MKKYFIPLFLIALIIGVSCKKNIQPDSLPVPTPIPPPSIEKKWTVTTVAGDGRALFADGPALIAGFKAPQDVAVTPDGVIYIADGLNHRIRKIDHGEVTTFAGFDRQDTISGIGTAAGFVIPVQIVSDIAGNLYTLDALDFRVRKITTPFALVTATAGSGVRGFADGRADTAMFGESFGIATDDHQNIYVSDWENKRIRKINNTGKVSTIAGPLQFGPGGITIDKQGNIYVVDQVNYRIRKITPAGEIFAFTGSGTAGSKDGNPNEAQFSNNMNDIVIDDSGNLYLTDESRIRKITPQGIVSTIAGSTAGYCDGNGSSAKFNQPVGLGIDANGNIYITEINNNRIRKLSFE